MILCEKEEWQYVKYDKVPNFNGVMHQPYRLLQTVSMVIEECETMENTLTKRTWHFLNSLR